MGCRWACHGGGRVCDLCRQLDGREFYYQPGLGQDCPDDMPGRPAHPNGRCSLEAIIDPASCEAMVLRGPPPGDADLTDDAPNPLLGLDYPGKDRDSRMSFGKKSAVREPKVQPMGIVAVATAVGAGT